MESPGRATQGGVLPTRAPSRRVGRIGLYRYAINARRPNQNGDVEKSHYRFKQALDQSLMLRESRDFPAVTDYHAYSLRLFDQLNDGCSKRFFEEKKKLGSLPLRRLDTTKVLKVKVGPSSTIRIEKKKQVDSGLGSSASSSGAVSASLKVN